MNREELLDKIEEITDKNYKTFRGTNEAELHTREEIADLIEQEKKAEVIAYMDYCFNLGVRAETAERWYEQFKEATK
jgi:hypothetical protein